MCSWNPEEHRKIMRQASLLAFFETMPIIVLTMYVGAILVSDHSCRDNSYLSCQFWLLPMGLTIAAWIATARHDHRHPNSNEGSMLARHLLFALAASLQLSWHIFDYVQQSQTIGDLFLGALALACLTVGGFTLTHVPLIGLTWLAPILTAAFGGVLYKDNATSVHFIAIMLLYLAFAVWAVVRHTKRTSERLETRIKAEEHGLAVQSLLSDFEENAGDWLWELDSRLRFSYVSPRMRGTLKAQVDNPEQYDVIELIAACYPSFGNEEREQIVALRQLTDNRQPFREHIVKVHTTAGYRWWSISGKPLLDALRNFQGWRGVCRDITSLQNGLQEMERHLNTDPVCQMPNRFYLRGQLENHFANPANLEHSSFALLAIEHFKQLNSVYGQMNGDLVLRETGQRLHRFAQQQHALAARMGGADFAVFFPQSSEYTEATLEILLENLAKPIAIANGTLEIRIKAGCVMEFGGIGGVEQLLQCSEMALIAAKEKPEATLVKFNQDMSEKRLRQVTIVNELRTATRNGEFMPFYQPQIQVSNGALIGAEALIRWPSPRVGMVPPNDFIPLAERNGYISDIGTWMLRKVCRDAKEWHVPLRVSVNASAIQLAQAGFAATVLDAATQAGIPMERLQIELTETALITDNKKVRKNLEILRDHDVSIALDDFGTGYSSLSYLSQYPISELKIDQSFVRKLEHSPESVRIVETIIRLARNLALTTIAEGVETELQADILRDLGCEIYQGYLYGKPMSQKDFTLYQCEHPVKTWEQES